MPKKTPRPRSKPGDKHNELTLVRFDHFVRGELSKARINYWLCRCDCGQEVVVVLGNVLSGRTKSCGCRRATKGGLTKLYHVEAETLRGMHIRCNDPSLPAYGGKGLKVCHRWRWTKKGLANFVQDMGRRPESKTSIDRIDNAIGYTCGKCKDCRAHGWPANCRWADWDEQGVNRTDNRRLTFKGKTRLLSEWAARIGITESSLRARLDRQGWSLERALTTKEDARFKEERVVTANGKAHTLTEWSRKSDLPVQLIVRRLYGGWDAARAVTFPKEDQTPTSLTYKGKTRTVKEWARRTGIKVGTIKNRLNNGWSPEKALTTPVQGST